MQENLTWLSYLSGIVLRLACFSRSPSVHEMRLTRGYERNDVGLALEGE